MDRVAKVEVKEDGKYFVGNLISGRRPKFLARNPEDGGLFLLLGEFDNYDLLKGTEEEGLTFCESVHSYIFSDCIVVMFQHAGIPGVINDPISEEERLFFNCGSSVFLDKVPFEIK